MAKLLAPQYIVFYTVVAIAAVLLLVGVILAFTVTETHTTQQVIQPTPTPTPTPSVPQQPVTINTLTTQASNIFTQLGSIPTSVTPVASTVPNTSATPSNVSPTIPQNMLPPARTFMQPLQVNPQSFGVVCMTADGSQLLSSMQNGEQSFAQFVHDPDDDSFTFATESYVNQGGAINLGNRIVKLDPTTGDVVLNDAASALGCLGPRSIVLSPDNLRLYVAYRDSTMSQDNTFPFEQLSGNVQVWSRQSTDVKEWSHLPNAVTITNPFTNQIAGIDANSTFNSFLRARTSGDNLGVAIAATSSGVPVATYDVAIGCQNGVLDNGRSVMIFREQNDFSYEIQSVLTLPSNEASVNQNDRNSFATAFAYSGDVVVGSLGSHDAPSTRRLAWFLRTNDVWAFKGFIPSPNTAELFGTSMGLNADGTAIVVGSPLATTDLKTIPLGGHVYLYTRTNAQWTLHDSLSDPYISSTTFPNFGTFGWFVNVDPSFRVVTVSANQDSRYLVPFPLARPPVGECVFTGSLAADNKCSYGVMEVFSIGSDLKFNTSKFTRVFQTQNGLDFVDPLFASRVDVAFTSEGVRFLAGSMLNQKMTLWTMNPS